MNGRVCAAAPWTSAFSRGSGPSRSYGCSPEPLHGRRRYGVRALGIGPDLVGVTEGSDLTSGVAASFTAEAASALAEGLLRG